MESFLFNLVGRVVEEGSVVLSGNGTIRGSASELRHPHVASERFIFSTSGSKCVVLLTLKLYVS